MPNSHHRSRVRFTLLLCAAVVLAVIAETAGTPEVQKGAIVLFFVLVAVACFLPVPKSSVAVDSTSDGWLTRLDGWLKLLHRLLGVVVLIAFAVSFYVLALLIVALVP